VTRIACILLVGGVHACTTGGCRTGLRALSEQEDGASGHPRPKYDRIVHVDLESKGMKDVLEINEASKMLGIYNASKNIWWEARASHTQRQNSNSPVGQRCDQENLAAMVNDARCCSAFEWFTG